VAGVQRLDAHLDHMPSLAPGLMAHARHLAALNTALRAWLAPQGAWAGQVTLANHRGARATLIVPSAATATLLRYRQGEILAWLGRETGDRFTRMDISIRALPGQRSAGV